MKKCPKCSKEFTDDIVYCTACNTPLEKVEQTTNTDTKKHSIRNRLYSIDSNTATKHTNNRHITYTTSSSRE
mgnify:CR=1 FL=1